MNQTSVQPVRSIAENISSMLPFSYWLTQFLFWELFLLGDFLISFSSKQAEYNTLLMSSLITFFAFTCIGLIYCSRELNNYLPTLGRFIDQSETELCEWYQQYLKVTYHSYIVWIAGLLMAATGIYTTLPFIKALSGESDLLFYYRTGYITIGFFFVGAGLWAIYRIIKMAVLISAMKIKVTVYQSPETSVLSLGKLYFRMALSISLTYLMIVITALLSPFDKNYTVLIWLVLAALSVLLFFLLPLYGVHKIMSREKNERLESFSIHIEKAMELSFSDPSTHNMKHLKELFELKKHIDEMNEWPFDPSALWQLITALLIPLGLAFVELLRK
jgi:hypothetical protein